MEGAIRPLFIFQDDDKTNKSIVMPDPNFLALHFLGAQIAAKGANGEA